MHPVATNGNVRNGANTINQIVAVGRNRTAPMKQKRRKLASSDSPNVFLACLAHNAAQPQAKTRRVIRRRACFVAPRCHHKAKVKLGPTRSFGRDALRRVLATKSFGRDALRHVLARSVGRDALRRVLARDEYTVIQVLRDF